MWVCVYIHTYTFFPFASNENLTDNVKYSGATCYPYEIIKTKKENGEINYPILSNMSVIAGEHAFTEADLFVSNTLATH
jgi:alanine dehydrogenase